MLKHSELRARICSLALVAAIVATLFPTTAFAVEGGATSASATVDEGTVVALQTAFDNANDGDTILLGQDITVTNSQTIRQDKEITITLDLNGHSISGTTTSYGLVVTGQRKNASLIIKDSGGSGKILITGGYGTTAAVCNLGTGTVRIENGTLASSSPDGAQALAIRGDGGKLIVAGGILEYTGTGEGYAILAMSGSTDITGGIIRSTQEGLGIAMNVWTEVAISGGTFTSKCTSESNGTIKSYGNAANLMITAGTVTNAAEPEGYSVYLEREGKMTKTGGSVGRVGPSYKVQGTITGDDISSGITATLQLKDSKNANVGTAVTASADGTYTIKDVLPGDGYTIAVTCNGYSAGTIPSFSVSRNNVTGKNLVLAKIPAANYSGPEAAAPDSTPLSKTGTAITLAAVTVAGETVEYAYSTTSTAPDIGWQDSTSFTGLSAETTYYFFARVKANSVHKAGTASAGTAIKTDEHYDYEIDLAGTFSDSDTGNGYTYSSEPAGITLTGAADKTYRLYGNGGTTVTYVSATNGNPITLDGVTLTGTGINGLELNAATTVTLKGSNSITSSDRWGVLAQDAFTVNGAGSLTVTGAAGITSGSTLTLSNTGNIAVSVSGDAALNGNSVAVTSGTVSAITTDSESAAIKATSGAITFSGADTVIKAKGGASALSKAPTCNDGLVASSGTWESANTEVTWQKAVTPPTTGGSTNTGSNVTVDGKTENIGKVENKGDTTTIVVDLAKLDKNVTAAKEGSSVVVPVATSKNAAAAQIAVKNVEDMAAKDMTLSVVAKGVTYELPALAIDTKGVLSQLGATDAAKVPFTVTITNEKNLKVEGVTVIGTPVSFTVSAAYNGKSVTIDRFGTMVGRTMSITADQAKRVTTAIVVEADGTTRHVPTYVYQESGKWYAKVSSMTNSTYALIESESVFNDVEGKWYADAANELSERKVTNGVFSETFEGEKAITRAEFATLLVNSLGLPKTGSADFSDVTTESEFNKYIATAAEYEIVNGIGNNRFAPDMTITRQEAMVMVARAAGVVGYEGKLGSLDAFSDMSDVGIWAESAVAFNVGSGLIVGNNGKLMPMDTITRAESSTVILRLLQQAELIDVRKSGN